jgi:chromosome segregation ATPase
MGSERSVDDLQRQVAELQGTHEQWKRMYAEQAADVARLRSELAAASKELATARAALAVKRKAATDEMMEFVRWLERRNVSLTGAPYGGGVKRVDAHDLSRLFNEFAAGAR